MGRWHVGVEDDLQPAVSQAAEQEAVLADQLERHHESLSRFLNVDHECHGRQATRALRVRPQELFKKFSRNAEGASVGAG
jgi:hypothetical protein